MQQVYYATLISLPLKHPIMSRLQCYTSQCSTSQCYTSQSAYLSSLHWYKFIYIKKMDTLVLPTNVLSVRRTSHQYGQPWTDLSQPISTKLSRLFLYCNITLRIFIHSTKHAGIEWYHTFIGLTPLTVSKVHLFCSRAIHHRGDGLNYVLLFFFCLLKCKQADWGVT